jgi:hypothetical protein
MTKFWLFVFTFAVLAAEANTVPPTSVTYGYQRPVWWTTNNQVDRFSTGCWAVPSTGFASPQAARDAFTSRTLFCFTTNDFYQNLYQMVNGVTFLTTQTQGPQTLILNTCLKAHQVGGCDFDNDTKLPVYASSSTLTMQVTSDVTCPAGFGNPKLTGETWTCSPAACAAAGTPSSLGRLTTISAITEMGYIVPVGSMPNPQCNKNCRVQHAGGQLQCTGHYPINGLVVGGPVYSSCTIDVTHTGTPCNYGGQGGIETLDEFVSRPASFTQQAGNNGGGDGGGDNEVLLSAIGDNTERTADGIDFAATTLTQIAANQVTADQKADARNTSLLNKLNDLLGKLTSIDAKTGQGGGGGPDEGEGDTTGGSVIGDIGTSVDHPDAGFQLPGETHTGLQALLAGTGIERAPGSCPTWTFNIDFLDASVVMDTHCTLWQQNALVLEALMLGLWTLGALFIVLSA